MEYCGIGYTQHSQTRYPLFRVRTVQTTHFQAGLGQGQPRTFLAVSLGVSLAEHPHVNNRKRMVYAIISCPHLQHFSA
jgi:hypothetical protein